MPKGLASPSERSGFRRQRERVCRSGIGPKQGGHDDALHDPRRYRYGLRFGPGQGFGRRVAGPIGERDRDQRAALHRRGRGKIAASKKPGMWMGGAPPPGYQSTRPQADRFRHDPNPVLSIATSSRGFAPSAAGFLRGIPCSGEKAAMLSRNDWLWVRNRA